MPIITLPDEQSSSPRMSDPQVVVEEKDEEMTMHEASPNHIVPPVSPFAWSSGHETLSSASPPSLPDALDWMPPLSRSESTETMSDDSFDESHYIDDFYAHIDEYVCQDNDTQESEIENTPAVCDDEELLREEGEGARVIYGPGQSPPAPADDAAIVAEEPDSRVDYLNYPWKEEDLWTSWRHLVSHRHCEVQSERLENAAWRAWAQCRLNPRPTLVNPNLSVPITCYKDAA